MVRQAAAAQAGGLGQTLLEQIGHPAGGRLPRGAAMGLPPALRAGTRRGALETPKRTPNRLGVIQSRPSFSIPGSKPRSHWGASAVPKFSGAARPAEGAARRGGGGCARSPGRRCPLCRQCGPAPALRGGAPRPRAAARLARRLLRLEGAAGCAGRGPRLPQAKTEAVPCSRSKP